MRHQLLGIVAPIALLTLGITTPVQAKPPSEPSTWMPTVTVQGFGEVNVLKMGQRSFVVKSNGSVAGLLTLRRIKETPRERWPTTTAFQAMIPASEMIRISPDAPLGAAIEEMDADGVNQLPVMDDGHLAGMLTRESIINFLRTIEQFHK
jgi:CBS domain-containing protein